MMNPSAEWQAEYSEQDSFCRQIAGFPTLFTVFHKKVYRSQSMSKELQIQ